MPTVPTTAPREITATDLGEKTEKSLVSLANQPQEPEPQGEGTMSDATAVREVKFWTCYPDAEHISHHSVKDAVETWADNQHPDPLPEMVMVHGYAPLELPSAASLARDALDRILESLDEEYADPDDSTTKPTAAMRAAALQFAETIRAEYDSWMCEEVTHETVRVADYYTPVGALPFPEAPNV